MPGPYPRKRTPVRSSRVVSALPAAITIPDIGATTGVPAAAGMSIPRWRYPGRLPGRRASNAAFGEGRRRIGTGGVTPTRERKRWRAPR